MQRIVSASMAALLVALLGACSSFEVATDWDPAVDFSTISTYAWLERPDTEEPDPETLLTQRIVRAIDSALAEKGMSQVPADDADVLVTYHVEIREKLSVNTRTHGYSPHNYRGATASTTVQQYDQGTLLIDLIDPGGMQLLWRGSAQSRIRYSSTPEEREERIRAAVAAILKDYPPLPKT